MRRAATVAGLFLAVSLDGCGAHEPSAEAPSGEIAAGPRRPVSFVEDDELEGMRIHLGEAESSAPEAAVPLAADAEPLDGSRVAELLRRVRALKSEPGDEREFALRKSSRPPPRTGETVDVPFPPELERPAPERGQPGELEVLRFAPAGDVPIAPRVSVTFSRPMVAVGSQERASRTVPLRLEPEPAGEWRWLGARTLLFDAAPRLPMATDYRAVVPAGTSSATGDKLEEELAFEFSTPAVGIERGHPSGGPHELQPVIFVELDQRIDREALLPFLRLELPGGRTREPRLATDEEIEGDEEVRRLAERAEPGRWLALRPRSPLPGDSEVRVVLAGGAPSAEGPGKTPGPQSFAFRTYAPLKIVRHRCGWRDDCPPTMDWRVELNNPLDEKAFDTDAFSVEPEVVGLEIDQWGSTIRVGGLKKGRTTYTLSVPGSLTDRFGQRLGEDEHLTFEVGPAKKTLFGPGKTLVTLDPAGPPELPVHTINHSRLALRVHRVSPADWPGFVNWMQRARYEDAEPGPMPGEPLDEKTIRPDGESDALTRTGIDLEPYLRDGHGQLLVHIEPLPRAEEPWNRQLVIAWVQVTEIGLTAFVDNDELLGWTTCLADGEAIPNAELELLPDAGISAESDESGLARLKLGDDAALARVLAARRGSDSAILPARSGYWYGGGGWQRVERNDALRWYAFDDRGLYRPGEEVRVKGWMRRFEPGTNGDVRALERLPKRIEWTLRGPRGNELLSGKAKPSRLAGFEIGFELPGDVNLGTAWLELTAVGADELTNRSHTHAVRIREFRRPEFEVGVEAEPGPWFLGEEAIVTANASYYSGGGLPGAPVSWRATIEPASYVPPGRSDFRFGTWSPWWRPLGRGGDGGESRLLKGATDALGNHGVGIHFEAMNPARPYSVRAEATVTDVNRQAWSAAREILVHPAELYVGLRTERGFVGRGDPIEVEALVVDVDGEAVEGVDVSIEAMRERRGGDGGGEEGESCSLRSRAEPRRCVFHPEVGGSYRITAEIRDGSGRRNSSELRVWVAGGERPDSRGLEREEVEIIPEREQHRPGDTARLLVRSPFHPAEGLLTVRRSGLVRHRRFSLDEPSIELEVPIEQRHIPNVEIRVDLVGSAEREPSPGAAGEDLPRRTAYASGGLEIPVPPLERALEVEAVPREETVEPGGETTIDLCVRGADGEPVEGAEVAIAVADESVLALSDYRLPDPIEVFYASRPPGVSDFHSRDQVLLVDPSELLAAQRSGGLATGNAPAMQQRAMPPGAPMAAARGGGGGRGGEVPGGAIAEAADREMDKAGPRPSKKAAAPSEPEAIAIRSDFRALALFAPEVRTDERGRAAVPLELPDSLTRYRVMAVAVHGGQRFGSGESAVTARLPLMVRPSAPRFLNFGDRFELPVVLHNRTEKPLEVEVAVRAANAGLAPSLDEADPAAGSERISTAGRRATVPAGDRVEVRFPAAAQMAGTARFQVAAAARRWSDAASVELPVWTPATSEAFATYGEIDAGALEQPVRAPDDVWPQFGGLEVTVSSTQLQALTDAVLFLVDYPFDCNEQIASRLLAISALRDVLAAFDAEGLPPAEELEDSVKRDLERLGARQNSDGGFSFWRRGDRSWPYLSIHAAHAMARAREEGYEVAERSWRRSERYLDRIERHIPPWYSRESRWALRAYALAVRHRMGDSDGKEAAALLEEAGLEGLSLEAQGWILPVLHAAGKRDATRRILRHLENRIDESAATAHFTTGYSDGEHVLLHSDRRADGVILEGLIDADPESDVIPKVVRGLLAHRERGRWLNTQENALVLVAIKRYFDRYEKVEPDFVARVWLGEGLAGEHEFSGRSTERARIEVPMSHLAEREGRRRLLLHKDGEGRLYYRIGMRYAPRSLELEPADYGFAVQRGYEAVDDPDDVRRDESGRWRIRAGARVRVRVEMAVPSRRYHVALVDPLPAGLEVIDPALEVSGEPPADPSEVAGGKSRFWWWLRPWYEHQNLRDERVEAFASLVWDGVHEYSYVARATTPGRFVVPPARAEEMYHPETFGRSATDHVVIE